MRKLHLKLFYLRTRFKREPQGVTAKVLGVRPATMSHLEQGRSLPTLPMLMSLARHYDVTPSYLLDDDRPIEPQIQDRWSERGGTVARGHWLEVPEGAAISTNDGNYLCPVMSGSRFYDATAQADRILCANKEETTKLEQSLAAEAKRADRELETILSHELMGQRKPRNKGNGVTRPATRRSSNLSAEA